MLGEKVDGIGYMFVMVGNSSRFKPCLWAFLQ